MLGFGSLVSVELECCFTITIGFTGITLQFQETLHTR
jgi:hypothetical protein